MNEIETYIRAAAIARGIDPDTALTVARHEGGLKNPFRRGEGPAPKSQAKGMGATENSWGPFQLYISGTGAGLGDRAVAAGIDPQKNWKGGVDFALDEVVRKGWGQWYGAKAAGITGMHGVGKNAKAIGTTLTSNPTALAANDYPPQSLSGAGSPGTSPFNQPLIAGGGGTDTLADSSSTGTTETAAATDQPMSFADKLVADLNSKDSVLGSIAGAFKKPQVQSADTQIIPSGMAAQPSVDPTTMANAQQLMSTLLAEKRKRYGLNLMG